jgi:hypothetical protein
MKLGFAGVLFYTYKLLDCLKETRRYWKLKEEARDRTLWRARFGRGYSPVVRQTTEWMNEWMKEWMDEWMDGWMNEWMDGWMDGWMSEWMN